MKNVEVGDMAVVGAPLLKVEDNTSYRLEVLVGESYMDRIKLGDEAPVTVDALPGKPVAGRVGEIVPASDAQSRSFVVKLDLPAVPGLRSGMFGRAAFAMGQRDAITVPSAAVVERGQLTSVYVVDAKGVAHLRLVRTGKAYGGRTEVLSGLSPGERIVADKADQVHEGSHGAGLGPHKGRLSMASLQASQVRTACRQQAGPAACACPVTCSATNQM